MPEPRNPGPPAIPFFIHFTVTKTGEGQINLCPDTYAIPKPEDHLPDSLHATVAEACAAAATMAEKHGAGFTIRHGVEDDDEASV